MNAVNTAWNELPNGAKAFRVAHGAYSVVGLGSLATIWWSAASRRRNRLVRGAVLFLLAEGGALIGGRGNCPFGPFQASLGDPVPFFELILQPRAAKAAIPILAAASLAGLGAMAARPPDTARSSDTLGDSGATLAVTGFAAIALAVAKWPSNEAIHLP
jgi:hypothetical protein